MKENRINHGVWIDTFNYEKMIEQDSKVVVKSKQIPLTMKKTQDQVQKVKKRRKK